MKKTDNPGRETWPELLKRPVQKNATLEAAVRPVLDAVRADGDAALLRYTAQFDGVTLNTLTYPAEKMEQQLAQVPQVLKDAIDLAAANIRTFHAAQVQEPEIIETMPGVRCYRKSVGIETVGLYIPGGTAPLFSTVLMLGIPAQLAGCKNIYICTPPDKNGELHPALVYAAYCCGIKNIYTVGGAQAVAAMAYGTATIPKADKIFGPGNQYVTLAKQLVQQDGVAIDMPAGPSELAILADDAAVAEFVAADLLSQAEHGPDSQVILVTDSPALVDEVMHELEAQLAELPRAAIATQALHHARAVVVKSLEEGMALLNHYAPEHLLLAVRDPETWAARVVNAGSVFLGNWSPESVGDYASGTNHTLPTNGYARAYSGVSLDSFVKKITFQQLTPSGLQLLGKAVEEMAAAEGLDAHRLAVTKRLNALKKQNDV
jgi:histidinol dehydrogenase